MTLEVQTEQEVDGRWIAEIPLVPGAIVYADTEKKAREDVVALARQIIAERADGADQP